MLYGIVFLLFAGQLVLLAVMIGGWAWALLWPAVSFAVVSLAYLGLGPRVFGKRADGTRHPLVTFLLFPFLTFTFVVWWVACRLSREPIRHSVHPNLFLGRRSALHELPPGVDLVVDLTCEFTDVAAIRRLPGYICVPTLDAMPPTVDRFSEAVRRAAECAGVVFVHCAQGHGRGGLFIAAILLTRGLANSPEEAVHMVRAVRPGVRLKPGQRKFLESLQGASSSSQA